MEVATKTKKKNVASKRVQQENPQTPFNVLRSKLLDAYNYASKNNGIIKNVSIEIQIGSIINKFFGGVPEKKPVSSKRIAANMHSRVISHSAESMGGGKKKLTSKVVVADRKKPKSIYELKVEARNLGLKVKGRDTAEQIQDMIDWHNKAERSRKVTANRKRQKKIAAARVASGEVASVNISADGREASNEEE